MKTRPHSTAINETSISKTNSVSLGITKEFLSIIYPWLIWKEIFSTTAILLSDVKLFTTPSLSLTERWPVPEFYSADCLKLNSLVSIHELSLKLMNSNLWTRWNHDFETLQLGFKFQTSMVSRTRFIMDLRVKLLKGLSFEPFTYSVLGLVNYIACKRLAV